MTIKKKKLSRDKNNDLHVVTIRGLLKSSLVNNDFEEIIYECDDLYPGIDLWYKKRVLPGFVDGSRLGHIVYDSGNPVAGAITKLSYHSKICSLRVRHEARGKGIGSALFGLAG